MTLGESIKKRREELKLSQECVADRLGVSRQAVSKWETGQSEPTASNLIQLADILEISLSQLVEPQKGEEEPAAFEKTKSEKKPNLILRANLIKLAIIAPSGLSVQLHLGNLPASAPGFPKQRPLPWCPHLLPCTAGS